MFATVRRYNIDPDKMDALVARVSGVAEVFRSLPGHVAYYLIRSQDGTLTAVGVFESREAAQTSRQVAAKWITENAADLLGAPSEVILGEVVANG